MQLSEPSFTTSRGQARLAPNALQSINGREWGTTPGVSIFLCRTPPWARTIVLSTSRPVPLLCTKPIGRAQLRPCDRNTGQFPSRRDLERRLAALPPTLPASLGDVGRPLVTLLTPWAQQGHGAACDSTMVLPTAGSGTRKDRDAVLSPSSIDTKRIGASRAGTVVGTAGSSCAVSLGSLWIPWRGSLRSLCRGSRSPPLCSPTAAEVRYVLGEQHYNTPGARASVNRHHRELVPRAEVADPAHRWGVEVPPHLSQNCALNQSNRSTACSRTSLRGGQTARQRAAPVPTPWPSAVFAVNPIGSALSLSSTIPPWDWHKSVAAAPPEFVTTSRLIPLSVLLAT